MSRVICMSCVGVIICVLVNARAALAGHGQANERNYVLLGKQSMLV